MLIKNKERTIEYVLDRGIFEGKEYYEKERIITGYIVDRYNLFTNPRRKREIISMEKDFIEEYVRAGIWNPAFATCECDTDDKQRFIDAFSGFLFHTSCKGESVDEDGNLDGALTIDNSVAAYFNYLDSLDKTELRHKEFWGNNWRQDAREMISRTKQVKHEL